MQLKIEKKNMTINKEKCLECINLLFSFAKKAVELNETEQTYVGLKVSIATKNYRLEELEKEFSKEAKNTNTKQTKKKK